MGTSHDRRPDPRHPCRQTEAPWQWAPHEPLLGEHNREVYGAILGVSERQVEANIAEGVF